MISSTLARNSLLLSAPRLSPLVRTLSTATIPLLAARPARRRRSAQEFLAVPRRAPPSTGSLGSPILEQASHIFVDVPEDSKGVLKSTHGSRVLLEQSALVITRQLEMMNIFLGFEQGNRYQICDPEGEQVGFIAEEAGGIMSTVSRQALRTHRPFRAVIMDVAGNPILWVRRPFQFINSRIFVHAGEEKDAALVGEAQQDWHLWRRKYNLFLSRPTYDPETGVPVPAFDQFAAIDEGLLAWEFWLRDAEGRARGSVSRNFGGFGREIFTDTGTYVLRFDAVNQEIEQAQSNPVVDPKTGVEVIVPPPSQGSGLTLDERAVALATAISIDFDYFSRHSSHHSGMGLPFFPFFGGVGGADLDSSSSSAPSEADPPSLEGAELPSGMRGDVENPSNPNGLPLDIGDEDWPEGGVVEERPWWEMDTNAQEVMRESRGEGQEEEVWGEDEGGGWGEGGGEGEGW